MNRFIWLIRRELWETRSVWLAPALMAAFLVGCVIVASLLSHPIHFGMDSQSLADMHPGLTSTKLDSIATVFLAAIMGIFFLLVLFTQFFYAADSLYGERRERAILFWKSLPLSDTETVLSKLVVAAVVMPAFATAGAFVAQLGVAVVAALKGASIEGLQPHLWNFAVWGDVIVIDLYIMLAMMLWCVPVVAFYLLVSAAVPRSPIAIAALLPIVVSIGERIAFGTHYVATLAADRSVGLAAHIFRGHTSTGMNFHVDDSTMELPHSLLSLMRPLDFLGSADLWLGLAGGAAFIAGAVWTRRYRDATY